ncbi:hypothetical protein CGRA01v4_00564 [Colletotrichum graminicola]|nr:hypothetical protein CGRA01v4_00564 [Colletotrichum graminicola]
MAHLYCQRSAEDLYASVHFPSAGPRMDRSGPVIAKTPVQR